MKKRTYIKPRVVGSADVHPCWLLTRHKQTKVRP